MRLGKIGCFSAEYLTILIIILSALSAIVVVYKTRREIGFRRVSDTPLVITEHWAVIRHQRIIVPYLRQPVKLCVATYQKIHRASIYRALRQGKAPDEAGAFKGREKNVYQSIVQLS